MSVLKRGFRLIGRLLGFVARVPIFLFGSLEWRAPSWLRWCGRVVQPVWNHVRSRPRLSALIALMAILLAGGTVAGYLWWQAQPKPQLMSFEVAAPERTALESNGSPRPLRLDFSGSVAPLAAIGKDVATGVEISPPIAGKWFWGGESQLLFQPKDDWPVGSEHKVTFARGLFSTQTRLEKYDFEFKAPPFVARIANAQFYQDPVNPAQKQAVFDLNFSHPVDPAELEKRLSLVQGTKPAGLLGAGGEKVKFTINYDKLRLNAYVHSETLSIPHDPSRITLTLAKGLGAARGGVASSEAHESRVAIPGLFSLAVRDVQATVVTNERAEPEHVLIVNTSETVHERALSQAISAWVLPLQNPERPDASDARGKRSYAWGNTQEITQRVLDASSKLALEEIPAERENVDNFSFRHKAGVGRYVYVQIEKGIRSFGGYELRERYQRIVRVPPFPSELKIVSQGALLAMSGEKKVALLVRDLPGIRIELGRVLPSQIQNLVSQTGGNFASPQFNNYTFNADNLTERFEREVPLIGVEPGRPHYESVNLADYMARDRSGPRGLFLLTVRGYQPKQEDVRAARRTQQEAEGDAGDAQAAGADAEGDDANEGVVMHQDPSRRMDRRLVLVTDLGLLVKRSIDGSQDVFVQSIHTGEPVANATVEVIGRNGLPVMTQGTDATGHVHFERLHDLKREKAPLMYLVRKGGDLSFLPLNRSDRGLDTSRFDVGGESNARVADQLSAYLFSDRGIYRPGETVHIGSIVKTANWTRSAVDLPLQMEVLDSRGLVVTREKLRIGAGGFNELSYTTLESSPTGSYTVNLLLARDAHRADRIGSTTFKVQEFQADRMKASVRLSAMVADGWVKPAGLKAIVNVQNLFGTPAADRRVEAMLTLSPAYPAFRGFSDYRFYDPQRAKDGYNDRFADGKTGEQGEAEFPLRLERYAKATYRVNFLARAFEAEGGRSAAAETSVMVSDLPFLVGFKADGALDHVSRGSRRNAMLIAIDSQVKRVAVPGLTLRHVERQFVSVLTRQPNGTYKYESRHKEVTLKEMPLAIAAAGQTLPLATDAAGNFAYVIRDAAGLELNRIEYSVAGAGNVTRSLERNAELQLTLNKKDYAPGEEIEVGIRAPYAGAGLITIERDHVYAHQWFKATTLSSVQKIRLPRDFDGNGYLSVQYIRDPGSDEIYASPLSYGVVPFVTSLAKRSNALKLSAPAQVRPGQVLNMKLSAAQGTRAVVFAVDEGVLQVAAYQMADPLGHFYKKRALEVSTSQILDLILPEFTRLMNAAAPGGDAEALLARHLNPFKRKRDKPVVYWSGIVDVAGEREFSYTVPDTFNGTLRLMAVAVNDDAIGTTQERTVVRGDFVLSPNLPLAVAPGDEFEVSVGVANNVEGSGKAAAVQVALQVPPAFEVQGNTSQTLAIGEMREGVALFRLKARDGEHARLGTTTLVFSARLGDKGARLAQDISVRPASPHYTQLTFGSYKGSVDVPLARKLHTEFRDVEAATSPVPLVLAGGLSSYLANFSHACTEQVVSQALPSVILGKRPDFGTMASADTAQKSARTLDDAIRVLRTRQNAEGGFGLWTASVQADEFASVYAYHLLIEAQERGDVVPGDLLDKGRTYLQQLAASSAENLFQARVRAYAAYLLTRQGVVTTPYLTALRETLEARYPKAWQGDLAAGYMAASYHLLKQDPLARSMMEPLVELLRKDTSKFTYSPYYDPLVRDTQTLYLLAREFPEQARDLPAGVFEKMVQTLKANRYNTLSAAYTILALDAYAKTVGSVNAKLSITEVDTQGKPRLMTPSGQLIARTLLSPAAAGVRFANAADITTWFSLSESGFDRTPPSGELKAGVELVREYLGPGGKPVTSVRLGDELTVRVRVRAIDRDGIASLAVVDLLPGGFEPVLKDGAAATDRLGGAGTWHVEYADVREDRVVFYGSAGRDVAEFSYRIKATNAGSFLVPPAYVESLYERDVQGRAAAGRINVTKPEPGKP